MEQKFKRKQFLINKTLQMHYMVTLLVPMLILLLFIGVVMFFSQKAFLSSMVQQFAKGINETIENGEFMQHDYATIVEQIKSRIGSMQGSILMGDLVRNSYKILVIGMLIVLFEIGLLTIFISHKIAGPVFRLNKLANDFKSGDFTKKIHLRKGDKLTDVAEQFNLALDNIQNVLRELCRTVEALEVETDHEKRQELMNNYRKVRENIKF
jgi:methyl-accepting chemotaxis protein